MILLPANGSVWLGRERGIHSILFLQQGLDHTTNDEKGFTWNPPRLRDQIVVSE
jgi:hypothetical protein